MGHFSLLFFATLLWLSLAVNAEVPGVYAGRPLESAPCIVDAASGTMATDAKSHRIEPELKKQIAIGRPHSAVSETNPAESPPDGFWQVDTQGGTYMYHTGAASSSPIPTANPDSHSWTHSWTSFKLHEIENETESNAPPPQSSTNEDLLKYILKLLIILPFIITAVVGLICSIFTRRRLLNDIEAGMGHIELM